MEGYGDKWRILSWDAAIENKVTVPVGAVAGAEQGGVLCRREDETAGGNKRKMICTYVITNKSTFINMFKHMLLVFTNMFQTLL